MSREVFEYLWLLSITFHLLYHPEFRQLHLKGDTSGVRSPHQVINSVGKSRHNHSSIRGFRSPSTKATVFRSAKYSIPTNMNFVDDYTSFSAFPPPPSPVTPSSPNDKLKDKSKQDDSSHHLAASSTYQYSFSNEDSAFEESPLPSMYIPSNSEEFAMTSPFLYSPHAQANHFMPSPISSSEDGYYKQHITYEAPEQVDDGSQNFPCPHCDKTFTKFFNLKSHLKTHSGDKGFQCSYCPVGFRRSHDLKRHIRSLHLASKAHSCGSCGKKFSRTDALKRHCSRPNSSCVYIRGGDK